MLRIAIVLLAGLIGTAHAQIVDSPRGLSMSAVRADRVGSSALMYNPAGLSRSYMYVVEAQYYRSGPGNQNGLGLNIIDTKTPRENPVPVGLSYGFQFTDGEGDVSEKGHDVRLGIAHSAIPQQLHLGVAFRYLAIERTAKGQEVSDLDGFTLDAGALIILGSGFQLGLVGENLVDIEDPALPRRAGGGLAYTGNPVVLDVDVMMDFQSHEDGAKPVVSVGTEVLLGGTIPLRGGYIHDSARETSWISGGLGFMTGEGAQGGQLTLAYRHNLEETSVFDFGVGLTVFL